MSLNFKKVLKTLTSLALGLTTGLSLHSQPVDALTTENISHYGVGWYETGYSRKEGYEPYTVRMENYSKGTTSPCKIFICTDPDHNHPQGQHPDTVAMCGKSNMVFCIDIEHGIPQLGYSYTETKQSKGQSETEFKDELKARTIAFLAKDYFHNDTKKASEAYTKIGYAQAAGYGFGGDTSDSMYEATQIVIWEYANNVNYKGGAPKVVEDKIKDIKRRVEKSVLAPDFTGSPNFQIASGEVIGKVKLTGYGKENALILTDKNGVLKWFEQDNITLQDPKLHLEINGNTCKIWADQGYTGTKRIVGVSRYLHDNQSSVKSGFLYDGNNRTQTCIKGGLDPTKFVLSVEVQAGEISVEKRDAETKKTEPQGEATFEGATFDLFYKDTKKKVENQTSIKLNKNGKPDHTWKNLDTSKKYYVQEVKQPTGYKLNSSPVDVSFTTTNGIPKGTGVIYDEVIKGKISIIKAYLPDNQSGLIKPEENAEFEIRNSDKKVVQTLKTDKNGKATSKALPYGKYTLKQTKAGGEYALDPTEHKFTIDKNADVNKPIKYGTIVNTSSMYKLQIVKRDKRTGEKIAYTGAKFKIYKDKEDKPISVKIGAKTYDTFITKNITSVNGDDRETTTFFADQSEEDGTVMTPLELSTGIYKLVEVQAPQGFKNTGYSAIIKLGQNAIDRVDDDGKPVVVVEVENEPIVEEFSFYKEIEQHSEKEYKPEDIEFTLLAKDKYVDIVSGETIAEAGKKIQTVQGSLVENRIVFNFSPVYAGEYILKETKTAQGLILDGTEHIVRVNENGVFIDDKQFTPEQINITFTNEENSTTFSKEDVGGKELEGAELEVFDKETGESIEKWTSTKTSHIVYGLVEGKKYILRENLAPLGYVISQDVEFVAGIKSKIHMVDTVHSVNKVDKKTGKSLIGAKLQVKDRNGVVVDEWLSNGKPYKVKNLKAGEWYTIEEKEAPVGYQIEKKPLKFIAPITKNTKTNFGNSEIEYIETGASGITPYHIMAGVLSFVLLGGVGIYALVSKNKRK